MKNSWKLFVFFLYVLGISSCALPQFKREKVQNYMLWYEFDAKDNLCNLPYNVILRPITSNNSLNTTYMLLFNESNNLSYIPYSRWRIPVPQMIDALIYRDLIMSGIFQSVSKIPIYDYHIIISGHIFNFWIDLRGSSPTLKVGLLFEVLQRYEGDNHLLFKKTYEISKSISNSTPEEYATAGSQAINEITKNFFKEFCHVSQRDKYSTEK